MGSTADWWYKDRLPELQRELDIYEDEYGCKPYQKHDDEVKEKDHK